MWLNYTQLDSFLFKLELVSDSELLFKILSKLISFDDDVSDNLSKF